MVRSGLFIALLVLGVGMAGCFVVEETVRTGASTAGATVGERIGAAVGQQIASAADLPPAGTGQWNQFMVVQAQVLFSYGFSPGGMWPEEATYEEGEWVRFQYEAADDGEAGLNTLERARLTTTEDGNEWWRIQATNEEDTWIYEALIDMEQEEVLRLRSKDPEGNVGEVPVTERTVYHAPQRLTEESIEGATVGQEDVDTPAGRFTTRRVEYTGGAGGGTVTWFLSDEVPGSVVRYRTQEADADEAWIGTLVDYGSDATTVLDSY